MEKLFEKMSTRSLKKMFVTMFVIVAIISFSGCAVVGGGYGGYRGGPSYYGGTPPVRPWGWQGVSPYYGHSYSNRGWGGGYRGGRW